MTSIGTEDITGVVLAGGRGMRMGGVDKGLQLLQGKALAAHVAERLAPQVARLGINANRNPDAYEALGFPVWPDAIPGFHGPLAGLHAALRRCETDYLACAPCDSPFLPPDLVPRLAAAMDGTNAEIAVAVTGDQASLRMQGVFCLMQASLGAPLERHLVEGGRRVAQWLASRRTIQVKFEDESAFLNINTLDDLRQSRS